MHTNHGIRASLFFYSGVGFFENTTRKTPRIWNPALLLKPLSNQLAWEDSAASRSPAIARTFRFVLHHFPSCSKDSVGDRNFSSVPSNQDVTSASLFSNPLRLHLRGLVFLVVASLAVGCNLLHPFLSVFTGTSYDLDFLHNWFPHDLPSGSGLPFWHRTPFGRSVLFPKSFPQGRIPAFCRRRRIILMSGALNLFLFLVAVAIAVTSAAASSSLVCRTSNPPSYPH